MAAMAAIICIIAGPSPASPRHFLGAKFQQWALALFRKRFSMSQH
jgi:hypothetical protein